jgi:hypothetical protein
LKPVFAVQDYIKRDIGTRVSTTLCFGPENEYFVDALGRIATETSAHVLTVHHNNKNDDYRGSTALVAGVDTHLKLRRSNDQVTLTVAKQKDAEHHLALTFQMRRVDIAKVEGAAHPIVFDRVQGDSDARDSSTEREESILTDTESKVLQLLVEKFGVEGATASEWEKVCVEAEINRKSYSRAKEKLFEKGAVLCPDKGVRGARFRPSAAWLGNEGTAMGTSDCAESDADGDGQGIEA